MMVWGVWTLVLVVALSIVGRYGNKFPIKDDWDIVWYLIRPDPVSTTAWLLRPHTGVHRIPLPKLILITLCKVTGYDFRAGVYFCIGALSIMGFAMILVSKRLRGHFNYSDAIFPLVFLHWGHGLLWWDFEVQFVTSTILALIRPGAGHTLRQ
jgi:hypothetical protein